MNLENLFESFFDDSKISRSRLSLYAHVGIDRMTLVNPGAVFAARLTATQSALAAMESMTTDKGVKLGQQKCKKNNKESSLYDLPATIAHVHAAVVAEYGKGSAEEAEVFPKGLTVFSKCKDEELENELGVVATALEAHEADLGPEVVAEVAG